MITDAPVDGNALGGLLLDVFGHEMTDARCCCARCGAIAALGAMPVYDQAPGSVMRCSVCLAVMLVAAPRETGIRLHFSALRWIDAVPA